MKESAHIQKDVESVLSDRRNAAVRLARERYNEVCDTIPDYRETDENIKRNGVKLGRLALEGKSLSEEYASLKKEIEERSRYRVMLLEKAGLKEDYLTDVYTCPLCQDTGEVISEHKKTFCSCYMKLYTEFLQKEANLIHNMGFEGFELKYYSEKAEDNSNSPLKNAEIALDMSRKFVENFGKPDLNNLMFTGGTGVGKTHLCGCIAYEFTKKGVPVLYLSAAELFDALTYYGEDRSKIAKREDLEKILYEVEILIIDDLGAEKQSAARYSILLELLNNRLDNKKVRRKTVVSSNLTLPQIKNNYDERIFSRLATFDICRLSGDDIRILKKLKK